MFPCGTQLPCCEEAQAKEGEKLQGGGQGSVRDCGKRWGRVGWAAERIMPSLLQLSQLRHQTYELRSHLEYYSQQMRSGTSEVAS